MSGLRLMRKKKKKKKKIMSCKLIPDFRKAETLKIKILVHVYFSSLQVCSESKSCSNKYLCDCLLYTIKTFG